MTTVLGGEAGEELKKAEVCDRGGEEIVMQFTSGGREMVNVDRILELLESVDKNERYTKVSLRNKSYSKEAAVVLGDFLRNIQSFQKLDLADMIAGRPEEDALEVLQSICSALEGNQVTQIDLSDNALGEKGIRACYGVLLNQENLSEVYFCNNGLSAAAACVIAEEVILFRGPDVPTKLNLFHFYNNMSGDGGAKGLARIIELSPFLTDLRFSATRAGREGCTVFATSLLSLKHLVKLDLSDNTFGEECGEVLAEAIKQQVQLKELNLRDAALCDEGAFAILEALEDSSEALETLDMSGNELTADSMRALVKSLVNKPKLKHLMLEENELGTKGAKVLAKGLDVGFKSLEKLILNVDEIGGSGALAIVRALKKQSLMKHLEMDGNTISAEALGAIEAYLADIEKSNVLGSLEDNMAEDDEDEDEVEDKDDDDDDEDINEDDENDEVEEDVEGEKEEEKENDDGLADLLQKTLKINSVGSTE